MTRLPLTECVEWRIAWFPLHMSRTLPPEKRHAAEILLGGALGEDELLLVRSSKGRILKPGLTGEALDEAYQKRSFPWKRQSNGISANSTLDSPFCHAPNRGRVRDI